MFTQNYTLKNKNLLSLQFNKSIMLNFNIELLDSVKSTNKSFRYNKPKYYYRDPINIYSFIHLTQYYTLAQIPEVKSEYIWIRVAKIITKLLSRWG